MMEELSIHIKISVSWLNLMLVTYKIFGQHVNQKKVIIFDQVHMIFNKNKKLWPVEYKMIICTIM